MSGFARALGIDLAAEPVNTGAAVVETSEDAITVEILSGRLDDDALVDMAASVDVVGLDAPLGWPDPFVDAVIAHHDLRAWPAADDPMAQRRLLSKRLTDRVVKEVTGLDPLPVAADRIAAVAMRAARLQTLFGERWGGLQDRSGGGRLVEAYPAAALKRWMLTFRGYKAEKGTDTRRDLVRALVEAAPWLNLSGSTERCLASDDCFDAVVTGLVALASKVGATRAPTDEERRVAAREGWIHLPTTSLAALGERLLGETTHSSRRLRRR
ncbi:MAG: DUF429 domain-containing protein [Actinomycetota bacterium]